MHQIQTVVMAGGSGTRLWPLSRKKYPKQFLPLIGDKTMMQMALERAQAVSDHLPIIITNEEHRFLAAEQLRLANYDDYDLILEPMQRNTAPAIALAAIRAVRQYHDPLLLVLAADHHIEDTEQFAQTVQDAASLAADGFIVTFGITPTRPETGYGYIQQGELLGAGCRIERFVEKPDQVTAKGYLNDGGYLWNSGMFLMRASVYLAELARFEPDTLTTCESALSGVRSDLDFLRIDAETFAGCVDSSIDYAVMEHTDKGVVVPFCSEWSDVGSFDAIASLSDVDHTGSVLKGDVETVDSERNLVLAGKRLVATLGVSDLVVVDTDDALLIAGRDHLQSVKQIVATLEARKSSTVDVHPEVARPWGTYQVLDEADKFKVKRIKVKPGAQLSVQMHHHRAEHWVVVSGTAKVRLGDQQFVLTENESTYISIGQVHSLANEGRVTLEIVEVQTGSYLGEDDIVRLDDQYGR